MEEEGGREELVDKERDTWRRREGWRCRWRRKSREEEEGEADEGK